MNYNQKVKVLKTAVAHYRELGLPDISGVAEELMTGIERRQGAPAGVGEASAIELCWAIGRFLYKHENGKGRPS